jgi:hypothetical protein
MKLGQLHSAAAALSKERTCCDEIPANVLEVHYASKSQAAARLNLMPTATGSPARYTWLRCVTCEKEPTAHCYMSGPAARCEFISTRQGVHFTNTCLAGQIDSDGVEAHPARLGWACEQQRAGLCQWRCCGSVPCAETRAFRAASKPRRKFCSLRVPSPKFLNWPRSSPPADRVPCRARCPSRTRLMRC